MKVIISGGGTGGHLYPALAIGREFAKQGADVLYIGSEFGIEKTIMPGQKFAYKLLPVKGFGSKNPVTLLKNAGLVKKTFDGVKILANGTLTKKLTVKAAAYSEAAKAKIEAAGGKAEVI